MSLLIVDDHEGFRDFLCLMLAREGFDVVGAVADGEAALGAIESLRPDVALVDVQLPGIDGIDLAARLAGLGGAPRVILTSSREAADYGRRLELAPVLGFIRKHDLSGEALMAMIASAS